MGNSRLGRAVTKRGRGVSRLIAEGRRRGGRRTRGQDEIPFMGYRPGSSFWESMMVFGYELSLLG